MKNKFVVAGFLLCTVSTLSVGKTTDAAHDPCANALALAQGYLGQNNNYWRTTANLEGLRKTMECLIKDHKAIEKQLKVEDAYLQGCDAQSAHWGQKFTALLMVLEPFAKSALNIDNADVVMKSALESLTKELQEANTNLAACDTQSSHWGQKISNLLTVLEDYTGKKMNIDNADTVMKAAFVQFIDALNALTKKINQDNAQITKGA